jgi:hypothetical protein
MGLLHISRFIWVLNFEVQLSHHPVFVEHSSAAQILWPAQAEEQRELFVKLEHPIVLLWRTETFEDAFIIGWVDCDYEGRLKRPSVLRGV